MINASSDEISPSHATNGQKILVLIDGDDCTIHNQLEKENSAQDALMTKIQNEFDLNNNAKTTKLYVGLGSNRASSNIEWANIRSGKTRKFFFPVVKAFSEKLKAKFLPLSVEFSSFRICNLLNPTKVQDQKKLLLLNLNMQKFAKSFPNEPLTVIFYDDNFNILNDLKTFYEQNNSYIPQNITLILDQHYIVDEKKTNPTTFTKSHITGTGKIFTHTALSAATSSETFVINNKEDLDNVLTLLDAKEITDKTQKSTDKESIISQLYQEIQQQYSHIEMLLPYISEDTHSQDNFDEFEMDSIWNVFNKKEDEPLKESSVKTKNLNASLNWFKTDYIEIKAKFEKYMSNIKVYFSKNNTDKAIKELEKLQKFIAKKQKLHKMIVDPKFTLFFKTLRILLIGLCTLMGVLIGAIVGATLGVAIGGGLGSVIPFWGTLIGAAAGGKALGILGAIKGISIGSAIGAKACYTIFGIASLLFPTAGAGLLAYCAEKNSRLDSTFALHYEPKITLNSTQQEIKNKQICETGLSMSYFFENVKERIAAAKQQLSSNSLTA